MTKSLRVQDMKAEKVLGQFMDKAFYKKLRDKNGEKIKFRREMEQTIQLQGVDMVLETPEKTFYIDEKASLYYSNLMIPTFAFEVDSIQKSSKEPIEGWLFNEKLKTEFYMLIWPNIKCKKQSKEVWTRKELNELRMEDFTIVEAMLIEKAKILEYLKELGYTKEKIKLCAEQIRSAGEVKPNQKYLDKNQESYFYFSPHLAEQPINIVIHKNVLKRLAKANYFISQDYYAKIPKEKINSEEKNVFI